MYSKTVLGLAAFCLLSTTFVTAVDLGSLTGHPLCDARLLACSTPFLTYATSTVEVIASYLVGNNCADVAPAKQCAASAVTSFVCLGCIPESFVESAMGIADSLIANCDNQAVVKALVETLLKGASG